MASKPAQGRTARKKAQSRKAAWADRKRRIASYQLETWPWRWWEGPIYARALAAGATPVEAASLATNSGLLSLPEREEGALPPLRFLRSYLDEVRPIATIDEGAARDALEAGLGPLIDRERLPHVVLRVCSIKHDYQQAKKSRFWESVEVRETLREVATTARKLDRILARDGVLTVLGLGASRRRQKDEPLAPRIAGDRLILPTTDIPLVAALSAKALPGIAEAAIEFCRVHAGNPGERIIDELVSVLAACFRDAADERAWHRMKRGHYQRFGTFFRLVGKALGDDDLANVKDAKLRARLA